MKWWNIGFVALALVSCAHYPAQASGIRFDSEYSKHGKVFEEVFEEQRQVLQASSAAVYPNHANIGYGIVISSDGWILTKASELENKESLYVRVGKTKYTDVKVVSVNTEWDVALIKVDAEGLTPIEFAESSELDQGTWVVSNGSTSRRRRRVSVGVISANSRAISGRIPIVMGVSLQKHEKGLLLGEVYENTGAEKAGLKEGDVLVEFDGVKVTTRKILLEHIKTKNVGDVVAVEVLREGKTQRIEMELMARHQAFEAPKTRNDQMSGMVSKRRDSFPRVIQHDTMLSDRTVGGPLIGLDGKCVGMNIARANRAETFAIPVEELKQLISKMMPRGAGED